MSWSNGLSLDGLSLPLPEAVALSRQADWEEVIRSVARVTHQTKELVRGAVQPLRTLGPCLVLPRHLACATCESWLLSTVATQVGVTPVQSTLTSDFYLDQNPEKRMLLHPKVLSGWGRNGGPKLKPKPLVSLPEYPNHLRLRDIRVLNGGGEPVNLVNYHREWWHAAGLKGVELELEEVVDVLLPPGQQRTKEWCYPVFFRLMCASAIFLENYSPAYCRPLYPLIKRVWQDMRQEGLQPRLVRLPLCPELDWFLAENTVAVPDSIQAAVQELLG